MQTVRKKGLSISIDEPVDLNRQSTATLALVDADQDFVEFEVPFMPDDLRKFAQGLKTFPRNRDETVELVWRSGRQKKSGSSIATGHSTGHSTAHSTGQLRLFARMTDVSGFSELKLEPLEVKTFVPGTKFSIAVGVQPLHLNQLGLSLETWLTRPSTPFSFSL